MKPTAIPKRRPAETVAGTVGTAVALLLAVLHAYAHFDLDPAVMPYVSVVVGWVAALVTWIKVRST